MTQILRINTDKKGKNRSPTFYVGFIKWRWISQDRILGYKH